MCSDAQVIDVPMRPGRKPAVMREAGSYTAWAECTANIDIESGLYVELPKAPDL